MNISIVILNWNGKYLGTFLPKLITSSPEANIYVADNGSSDGSVRFLQQNYPEIKVIPFTENHGFAKGYNLALNQIEADYYILLNTDIEVTDNWIQPVISVMEQDESIAACQPKFYRTTIAAILNMPELPEALLTDTGIHFAGEGFFK